MTLQDVATEIVIGHLSASGLPPLRLIPQRQWGHPETWLPFPSPSDLVCALRKYYHPTNADFNALQLFHLFITMMLEEVNWELVVARVNEDAKHRLWDAAVQGRKEFAKDCQGKTWEEYVPPEGGEAEGNSNIPPSAPESAAK